MRIVWLSANKFGLELLKEATKFSNEIVGIVTLDDNAKTIMYDSVKVSDWDNFGLPVIRVKNINDELPLVATLKPDLIVMAGWRQILGEEFLNLPKEGVVGFHPTLLPKGRGSAPIINSIISGFKRSGITFFYVGSGIDDGDIIGQDKFEFSIQAMLVKDLQKYKLGAHTDTTTKFLTFLNPIFSKSFTSLVYIAKLNLSSISLSNLALSL